jgi:hypothetical protein
MNRRLAFRDVLTVVERVPDLKGIVLVGGQALNFWAERLNLATAEGSGPFGAALSDDIDFLGSAKAALSLGEATQGRVAIAGMDDAASPNTALVTLDLDGEEHQIDFLAAMMGFTQSGIDQVREWAVPVRMRRGTPTQLFVMHPLHCLQAQLENVYGSKLNRREEQGGERYIARVRLAIEASRQIILITLKEQGDRPALILVEAAFALSMLPAAMRARFLDEVRIEQSIPTDAPLPAKFFEERLPQMNALRERQAERFLVRLPRQR